MSDIDECKLLERPECGDWQEHHLAEEWWPTFVERYRSGRHVVGDERLLGIESVSPSKDDFVRDYQGKRAMLVERGENIDYSLDRLVADFPETKMRVSDTHGGMVEIGEWREYATTTKDDSPFGLYDSCFDEFLMLDYNKPEWVAQQTCYLAALRCGVPLRWLLAGGPRSGTGPHVDPLGTHAWLHLCQGSKLWYITPLAMNKDEIDMPSAAWWWSREPTPDAVQFVQRPGELVYVPAGWTHCVLNLEMTLAVTENYYCDDIDALSSKFADAKMARIIRRAQHLFQQVLLRDDLLLQRIFAFCRAHDAAKIAATSRAFVSFGQTTDAVHYLKTF